MNTCDSTFTYYGVQRHCNGDHSEGAGHHTDGTTSAWTDRDARLAP